MLSGINQSQQWKTLQECRWNYYNIFGDTCKAIQKMSTQNKQQMQQTNKPIIS